MKVLVTDAEVRHSLAVIRSLGSSGADVIACSSHRRSQGFYSRFCTSSLVLPPGDDPDFIRALTSDLDRLGVDILIPVGDLSTLAVSRAADGKIGELCSTVLPEPEVFEVAADKGKTLELAEKMGIPIPGTPGEGDPFPRVVKPKMGGRARYVHDRTQMEQVLEEAPGAIVQELVPGNRNYAVCALMDRGRPLAVFTHRELRELPPTGGSATVAESIEPNEVTSMGLEILVKLGWHGVAMVEFKQDIRDGGFRLMEINPRFWASLELAIVSGIDFPLLTAKLAGGEDFDPVNTYEVGVKFRWLAQDILHVSQRRRSLPTFARDFLDPTMRYEIRVDDLKPHVLELSNSILWSTGRFLGQNIETRIA
jgi:predicted ATP-grasp superfamily ATP-dependent carboligase